MSVLSNVFHKVFGFVKTSAPTVEAEAKAILDKADVDVAALRTKAQADYTKAIQSQSAVALRAALDTITNAVVKQAQLLEAPAASPTGPTGPAA